jgi:hypothetical protein
VRYHRILFITLADSAARAFPNQSLRGVNVANSKLRVELVNAGSRSDG